MGKSRVRAVWYHACQSGLGSDVTEQGCGTGVGPCLLKEWEYTAPAQCIHGIVATRMRNIASTCTWLGSQLLVGAQLESEHDSLTTIWPACCPCPLSPSQPLEAQAARAVELHCRYDGLVGMFSGKDIAAVGVSIGIERLFTVMSARMGAAMRATQTQVSCPADSNNSLSRTAKG